MSTELFAAGNRHRFCLESSGAQSAVPPFQHTSPWAMATANVQKNNRCVARSVPPLAPQDTTNTLTANTDVFADWKATRSLPVGERTSGKHAWSIPASIPGSTPTLPCLYRGGGTPSFLQTDGSEACGKTAAVTEQIMQPGVFPIKQQQQELRGEEAHEVERRERRRAQNRRAAQRCRAKRKLREMAMLEEVEKETMTMRTLEAELQRVTSEKRQVEVTLLQHGVRLPATGGHSAGTGTFPPPFCFQ